MAHIFASERSLFFYMSWISAKTLISSQQFPNIFLNNQNKHQTYLMRERDNYVRRLWDIVTDIITNSRR